MQFTNFNNAINGSSGTQSSGQSSGNIFTPLPGAPSSQGNNILPTVQTPKVQIKPPVKTSSEFLPALGDTLNNMFVKPAERVVGGLENLGGAISDATDGNQNQISADLNQPHNMLFNKNLQPDNPGPTNPQGSLKGTLQTEGDLINTAGEVSALADPAGTVDDIFSSFKSVLGKDTSGIAPGLSSLFSKTPEVPEIPDTPEMNNAKLKLQSAQDEHVQATKNLNDSQTKTPELNQKVTDAQAKIDNAQQQLDAATKARQAATEPAVKGSSDVKGNIKTAENSSGMKFQQAGTQLKNFDPELKADLSNDLLGKINGLKEGKNFDLPDYLSNNKPIISIKGQDIDLGNMSPDVAAKLKAQLGDIGSQTGTSLDPEQMQDLIKRLNGSTFKEVGGELQTDQQRIDITNEVKDLATKAFGNITDSSGESVWNKAYQDYAQSKGATDDLKNLLDIKSKTTPDEIMSKVQKLQKTPETKMILQNSVNEVKNLTGIDLNDPIQAIQQVMDKQIALEEAQGNLTDAQKQLLDSTKEQLANAKNQSEAEQILKKSAQQEQIQSNNYEITKRNQIAQQTFKGRNPLLYKTMVRGAIGGTVLLPLFFARYVLFRKLYSLMNPPKKPTR